MRLHPSRKLNRCREFGRPLSLAANNALHSIALVPGSI
jgi:hypothetical protein